jgi:DnaJ-class molecular chaperone
MASTRTDAVARVLTAAHAFDALGLPTAAADPAVVKAAYRKAALSVHPDKSDDPRAEQAFKQLGESYEVLLDPLAQAELLALCSDRTSRRKRSGAVGGAQTQRQQNTTRPVRQYEDGPHTTVYFRSAHKEREEARAKAAEKKRQRQEREMATHRAEIEARMQTLDSSSKSWQSWTGGSSNKRQRSNDRASPVSSKSTASTGFKPAQTVERYVCMTCRRQFKEKAALERHEQHSELHRENLRKQVQVQNQQHEQQQPNKANG